MYNPVVFFILIQTLPSLTEFAHSRCCTEKGFDPGVIGGMKESLVISILVALGTELLAQQTEVWFLYGSRPAHRYKSEERKWFGGKKGGHVGVGNCSDSIVHFLPAGNFHVFPHRESKGRFVVSTKHQFLSTFSVGDSVKYICIKIPQAHISDSAKQAYLSRAPYGYSFFGMRCASAAADLLIQSHIIRGNRKPWLRYFYPARLRKKLLRLARKNNWEVIQQEGSVRRKWEN